MNTRQTILAAVGILVIVAIGVWWYFGFTLDFMRFFAAETLTREGPVDGSPTTSPDRIVGTSPAPEGCYYQEVQCIKAPCNPVLVCPSCVPRPSCMKDNPPCAPDLAPGAVLCPEYGVRVSCSPETQTVEVGQSANLSATGGNGYYLWFTPEGQQPPTGLPPDSPTPTRVNAQVRYDAPGIKKVTVQSSRDQTSAYVDSVACTVVVVPVGI